MFLTNSRSSSSTMFTVLSLPMNTYSCGLSNGCLSYFDFLLLYVFPFRDFILVSLISFIANVRLVRQSHYSRRRYISYFGKPSRDGAAEWKIINPAQISARNSNTVNLIKKGTFCIQNERRSLNRSRDIQPPFWKFSKRHNSATIIASAIL